MHGRREGRGIVQRADVNRDSVGEMPFEMWRSALANLFCGSVPTGQKRGLPIGYWNAPQVRT